jgi:hypothetical protein
MSSDTGVFKTYGYKREKVRGGINRRHYSKSNMLKKVKKNNLKEEFLFQFNNQYLAKLQKGGMGYIV